MIYQFTPRDLSYVVLPLVVLIINQARPRGFLNGCLSIHKEPGISEMISEKKLFILLFKKWGSFEPPELPHINTCSGC